MTDMTKTFSAFNVLLHKLEGMIAHGDNVRNTLAAKFTKSLTDAEYEMRWLDGKYRIVVLGSFASTSLEWLKKEERTTQVLEELFREQLKHWHPEHSTSPYSNACNDEKFEALKEIIEVFARFNYVATKGG